MRLYVTVDSHNKILYYQYSFTAGVRTFDTMEDFVEYKDKYFDEYIIKQGLFIDNNEIDESEEIEIKPHEDYVLNKIRNYESSNTYTKSLGYYLDLGYLSDSDYY